MSLCLLWAGLLLELNKAPEGYLHVDVVVGKRKKPEVSDARLKISPLKLTSNSVTYGECIHPWHCPMNQSIILSRLLMQEEEMKWLHSSTSQHKR